MNISIHRYTDEFPKISSDLHNSEEFISCATKIIEVMEKYAMRCSEAQVLLENILNLLYRYSKNNYSDMKICYVKEYLEQKETTI